MTTYPRVLTACAVAALFATASPDSAFATACTDGQYYRPTTGRTVLVSSTTARPNDGVDDTVALQSALDSLLPGDELLFDVPGVYHHNLTLYVRRPGVIVNGNNAELRGTNPDDQAIMVQSDDVDVTNFIINNVTNARGTSPKHPAISLNSANEAATQLHRIRILNNVIRGDGTNFDPGTPTQASSSGGVFVRNVDGFVIANNRIIRSLADGIHITRGSRNGRVLSNYIESGGDDGIAMVTYLDKEWRTKAADFVSTMQARDQVRNIFVYHNTVKGNYWGRGIAVVGARDITIDTNYVTEITRAGGIYIAHEYEYSSYGVYNVLVINNVVDLIAKTDPLFVPKGPGFAKLAAELAKPNVTGHGGIEVYGPLGATDWVRPGVPEALPIERLLIQNNSVTSTKWPGLRLGANSAHFSDIGIVGNFINNPWHIQIIPSHTEETGTVLTFDKALYCVNNYVNGVPWPAVNCQSSIPPVPTVTGFTCNPGQI